jgi:hypothetical protein
VGDVTPEILPANKNRASRKGVVDFFGIMTADRRASPVLKREPWPSVTLTGFFPGIGPSTFAAGPVGVPGVDIKQTISVVKFGINYRFSVGGAAPVVASY